MSTRCSSAASKLSSVLPCARWWAPLCPTRLARRAPAGAALIAGTPGHHDVGRLPSPWPRDADRRAAARAGAARTPVDALRRARMPWSALSCIRGRTAWSSARTSSSVTSLVLRQGSTRASQQASHFHRFPMPATVRWSSSASPIGRVGSSSRRRVRTRRSSSSGARMSGPRPLIRGSWRARASVISSSTGPSNSTTSWSPRLITSQARRGCRRQRRPRVVRAPGARSSADASAA